VLHHIHRTLSLLSLFEHPLLLHDLQTLGPPQRWDNTGESSPPRNRSASTGAAMDSSSGSYSSRAQQRAAAREHDHTPRGPPSRAGLKGSLACAFLLTLPTFHIRHRAHSNLRAFPKNTPQLVNLPIELLEEIISRLHIESLFCLATFSQRGTPAVGRDLPTHPELPPVDHLQKHSSWLCPISPVF
jgi:hypothetical protein